MKTAWTVCCIMLIAGTCWGEETTTTTSTDTSTTTTTSTDSTTEVGNCSKGTDEYCGSCDGTKCTNCYASFLKENACEAPTTAIDNCVAYSSATVCSACNLGYEVKDSKCSAITITNCLVVSESKCVLCDNGLHDAEGKCPGTTACTIENCKWCNKPSDAESCSKCNDGYLTSGTSCVTETTALAGCQTHADSKCSMCAYGYYVKTYTSATEVTCAKSSRYTSIGVAKWGFVALLTFFIWSN